MASNFVSIAGEESQEEHALSPVRSPRELRRSWSSNSSACGHGTSATAPKCVCAPATHAGSFKCRLHRMNSQGHHSAPTTPLAQPPPAVSSTSTRTVEAQ